MAKDSALLVIHFRTWKKDVVVFICHVLYSDFTVSVIDPVCGLWTELCLTQDATHLFRTICRGSSGFLCLVLDFANVCSDPLLCVFRWCLRLTLKAIVTTRWPYCSVRTPTPPQLWSLMFPTDASHVHTRLWNSSLHKAGDLFFSQSITSRILWATAECTCYKFCVHQSLLYLHLCPTALLFSKKLLKHSMRRTLLGCSFITKKRKQLEFRRWKNRFLLDGVVKIFPVMS